MHVPKVVSFIYECRSGRDPDIFLDYYKVRETGPELKTVEPWITHGQEPIWVQAVVISKGQYYEMRIWNSEPTVT